MCGIVTFWGQEGGLRHVLEALHLSQYRSPDSTGVAALRADGSFVVRRSVGKPRRLVRRIADEPLFAVPTADDADVDALVTRQRLASSPAALRDCTRLTGSSLYESPPLYIGIGDRGGWARPSVADLNGQLSQQMLAALREAGAAAAADLAQDPVTHAFRMVGAHVAARVPLDGALRRRLDAALQARLPHDVYADWQEAWAEEIACNVPGHAFSVAVRDFQTHFPGLAPAVDEDEWERVGGLTAHAMGQMVMGHGRWAMVGAVSEGNAHPFLDQSCTRVVCENGSHNARVMLGLRAEQEAWWRARLGNGPVHRSENTTEVIAYEWERVRLQLDEGTPPPGSSSFLHGLDEWGVDDAEERALRLALWRMREGNAHACAYSSRQTPGVLYVSSHHKPVAIVTRTINVPGAIPRQELMVASDVNAALMLWTGAEVDAAAADIRRIQSDVRRGSLTVEEARAQTAPILARFAADVIYLDAELGQGRELLARISNRVEAGRVKTQVDVSTYDGTPLYVRARRIHLNPAIAGKGGYDTYTESHIAEIPDVVDGIVRAYVRDGRVQLESSWQAGSLLWPGLNADQLRVRFGEDLGHLRRILLMGEGSSWNAAQAAAPLFRALLPGLSVNVYRPVEILNLGKTLDPAHDLAVEISWSGTTDSLLKVDAWLTEADVLRLAVTGRAQSDLGRRTAGSGGTLDVRSDVEISVATVKGFEATVMTLNLLALKLAAARPGSREQGRSSHARGALLDELSLVIPRHVRTLLEDKSRRERLRQVAEACRDFNKVAVVGDSPIILEGELKIEELAQIVALPLDFHATSLRPLVERSALAAKDAARTLFICNATTPEAHAEARALIAYLQSLGVSCVVHTTSRELGARWQEMPNTEVFFAPQVSPHLQSLLDTLFFFDFAVALAYARGLSPEAIDSPRNLAKSVTTTGAERRATLEDRHELSNVTLGQFSRSERAQIAWDARSDGPSRAAFRATVALRAALSVIGDPLPEHLDLGTDRHLLVITDTEATENGAHMAAAAWQELLDIDLAVYRRFVSSLQPTPPGTAWLRLVRAGIVLAVHDAHTIALPADMSPLQLELLGTVYLTSLAVRRAQQQGMDVTAWQSGLAQLPLVVAEVLTDGSLAASVREALAPYARAGYDKFQVIGGGQDYASAVSIARSLRMRGFVAEPLYTDSAWHGPLATVGGGSAESDTLIIILATDPLFQAGALVDTQVYRTRNAPVLLVIPEGNERAAPVLGVDASAHFVLPGCPRPFLPVVNAALGDVVARQMVSLSTTVDRFS